MVFDKLLEVGKLLVSSKTIMEDGIDTSWLPTYSSIAQCFNLNRDIGILCYIYEVTLYVRVFLGGLFDDKDWKICLHMERQLYKCQKLYKGNYIKTGCYSAVFGEVGHMLRTGYIAMNKKDNEAKLYAWRYSINDRLSVF